MSVYSRRCILIVRASDRDAANGMALQLDPIGGAETFTAGLSPDGSAPSTHFWCCAALSEAAFQQVLAAQPSFPGSRIVEWDMDADPGLPARVPAEMGLAPLRE